MLLVLTRALKTTAAKENMAMTIATCEIGDCQNKSCRKGLCQRHYNLERLGLCVICNVQPATNKTGECTDCKQRGGPPPYRRGAGASITAAHNKVKRERGNASDYKCGCGNQAAQWALTVKSPSNPTQRVRVWDTMKDIQYSFNANDYKPMCVSCHISFDRKVY